MMNAPVLIIHDNSKVAHTIKSYLSQQGYSTQWHTDLKGAPSGIDYDQYALLIADENAISANGQSIYENFRKTVFSVPVIFLSEKASIQRAVEAIKIGASDYLSTPLDEEMLLASISKALSIKESHHKRKTAKKEGDQRHLITCSESMQHLLSVAQQVAESSATVLIQGESGTGKELLARYIHQNSDRKNQPFIAMNCAALPENLAESELFGYEKGAFTGAAKTRPGRFELANKGTLLLDEISEMPLVLQAKLLRVLQEKEVDHLGGTKPVQVDVRCIATSNQDLSAMVKEGRFRKDLYYRLRVIPLRIPPLRERKEDIPVLLEHFIHKFHPDNGVTKPRFEKAALEHMCQWHWPGNVRELENTVERALLISKGPVIGKAALFLDQDFSNAENKAPDLLVGMTVKELEKKLINKTLSHLNHNRTHAAKMLGISIRTLRNKLREYQANGEGVSNAP